MAKNVKTAAVKGRETKLSRKSNEELISIILRKDNTESNLQKRIINLKAEVNTLSNKISSFHKDCEGTDKAIENYKEVIKTKQESIDSLISKVKKSKEEYETLYKDYVGVIDKYSSVIKIMWLSIIGFAVCLFGWLLK